MYGCKDRHTSNSSKVLSRGVMCNCASAEVKSQETETVFEKVVVGRYVVTNCRSNSHLQEQSCRERLVWTFLMKLLIAVNMPLITAVSLETPLNANHQAWLYFVYVLCLGILFHYTVCTLVCARNPCQLLLNHRVNFVSLELSFYFTAQMVQISHNSRHVCFNTSKWITAHTFLLQPWLQLNLILSHSWMFASFWAWKHLDVTSALISSPITSRLL